MRHGGGLVHLGYQTHYVVDGGKQRMILAALVTPAEVMENQPMLDLQGPGAFPRAPTPQASHQRHEVWHD